MGNHTRSLFIAGLGAAFGGAYAPIRTRSRPTPENFRKSNWGKPHQGKREMARRVRQMGKQDSRLLTGDGK